jgi:AbrB family looped-hinge helix DNA binding protein
MGEQTGIWFKASVLEAPQPFNGTALPVAKVPNFTHWSAQNTQKYLSYQKDERIGMVKRKAADPACAPGNPGCGCRVEAVLGVDERGQMVLPKEIRDRAGIRAGEKLAVVSWEKDGEICCMVLVKAEELTGMVKSMLGPVMKEYTLK